MSAFVTWLMGSAGQWVAGTLAALIAGLSLYAKGRSDARSEAAGRAAEAYAQTRKDMDDVDVALGDDPASLRDWLRERDPNKR